MLLTDLISDCNFPLQIIGRADNLDIRSLTDDSRKSGPGVLFCVTVQGRSFVSDAARNRSPAFLMQREIYELEKENLSQNGDFRAVLIVPDVTAAQGLLASALYEHPSRSLSIAGVTGTNGKTTVTWMLYHIWKSAGRQAGVIGTLGVRWTKRNSAGKPEEIEIKTGYTTPRSPELHSLLARMRDDGVTHVAMEVSSEALALGRLEGCKFSTAVFTNLTPDHLDYHTTMEAYFAEKMKLLRMTAGTGGRIIVFSGTDEGRSACVLARELAPDSAVCIEKAENIDLPAPTGFNRINASLAVLASGENEGAARDALRSLPEIPGRFNTIRIDNGSFIVIDYAHTPDALEHVLGEARLLGASYVIAVFGCGGNRDKKKRHLMGSIAAKKSDLVIITDDNPRKENPEDIRREIAAGLLSQKLNEQNRPPEFMEIGDRRKAIETAVRMALEKKSAVIIAGKGHEMQQIFADRTEKFSDREVVQEILDMLKKTNVET